MEIIDKYFPKLSDIQRNQLAQLDSLYKEWNEQINVISRKDMKHFYERHVLHSMSIAKIISFKDGTEILDVGTGGGFPGVPLAILFPNCNFHLVDSIGKKIKVVQAVIDALELKNIKATHERAENVKTQYDFVVSRAVTKMPLFLTWVRKRIKKKHKNGLPNGILYLKGGDLTEEMKPIQTFYEYYELPDYFKEPFFETKKIVYVQV
ncbi:MAG: 16S rRNA (guanine(527)-N(7))-methyltransferase RsmG [Brumimicrobium sp.]